MGRARKENENLLNKTFGKLFVIGKTNNDKNGETTWKCICKDDHNTVISRNVLTKRLKWVKECGCPKQYSIPNDKLYTGFKLFRFTVIKLCSNNKWKLKCDCGTIKYYFATQLVYGKRKSCGCLNNEKRSERMRKAANNRADKNPRLLLANRIYRTRYSDGDLAFKEFYELSQKNCFYCNVEFSNAKKKKISQYSILNKLHPEELIFRYNGLDRIDSNLPHNKNNVVPSCIICNRSKRNMPQNVFLEYLKKIANHKIELNFEKYRKLEIDMSIFSDPKRYSEIASIKMCFWHYRDSNLTIEQFYKLSQLDCYYCGCSCKSSNLCNDAKNHLHNRRSKNAIKTGNFHWNGLDRIDSNLLHDFDNCISCCKNCNFTKKKLSIDNFYKWIDKIKEKWSV
jgi:hypothetical protein